MSDLISRKTAIETFTGKPPEYYHTSYIVGELNCLPSVDAVPVVHGRWTEKETSENTIDEWQSAKCTNCGKYHTTPYLYYFNDYKFCPNCGAKMDEEATEHGKQDEDRLV